LIQDLSRCGNEGRPGTVLLFWTRNKPSGRIPDSGSLIHRPVTRTRDPAVLAEPPGQRTAITPWHPAPTGEARPTPPYSETGSSRTTVRFTATLGSSAAQLNPSSHLASAPAALPSVAARHPNPNSVFRPMIPTMRSGISVQGSTKRARPVVRPPP